MTHATQGLVLVVVLLLGLCLGAADLALRHPTDPGAYRPGPELGTNSQQ